MSKNLDEIYTTNPITTNADTDLMYFMQADYGPGTDAAMMFANFAAQFPSSNNIQSNTFTYCTDTGTSSNYVINPSPAPSALVDGMEFSFLAANTNTIAPVIDVGSFSTIEILNNDQTVIGAGAILQNGIYHIAYQGGFFILLNSSLLGNISPQSYQVSTPSTGFTIDIPNNTIGIILNPSGTLASGIIQTPAIPIDGQVLEISSTQTVTSLSFVANAGQTVLNAPTTILANKGFSYRYSISDTTWYPRY